MLVEYHPVRDVRGYEEISTSDAVEDSTRGAVSFFGAS
jgi:hypothetical protein